MSNQQKLKKTTILVFALTIFIALISCNNEAAKPPEQIIVSYDANGGNFKTSASQLLEDGKELKIANYEGFKNDKPFLFWNTDKDGNGKIFTPGLLYTEKKSVKLYAEFGDTLSYFFAEDLPVTDGSLVFPANNYKKINDIAFGSFKNDKTSVTTITIPESVKLIGLSSFSDFEKLENLILNEKLQIIFSTAFSGCSSLKTVDIPKNVHLLDPSTFSGCTALKKNRSR